MESRTITIKNPVADIDVYLVLPEWAKGYTKSSCELYETIPIMTLPNEMAVDGCGAVVANLRTTTQTGRIQYCARIRPHKGCECAGPDTGEGLDAQAWEGNGMELHIGTEDNEFLATRSRKNEYCPKRLAKFIQRNPIATYSDDGMRLELPELLSGEELQLHYVIAWKKTEDWEDTSTRFAVDRTATEVRDGKKTGRQTIGWSGQ
jgi:hypothetical protein